MSKFQILKSLFQLHSSLWEDTYVFDITPLQTATVRLQASQEGQSLLPLLHWADQHFFVIQCLCSTHLTCKLDLLNQYLLTCGVCRPLSHDTQEDALVNGYNAFPTKWTLRHSSTCVNKTNKGIWVWNKGNVTPKFSIILFAFNESHCGNSVWNSL